MTDEYGQETSLTRQIKQSASDGPSRADSDTSWRRRQPGGASSLDPRLNKPPPAPAPYARRPVAGGGFGGGGGEKAGGPKTAAPAPAADRAPPAEEAEEGSKSIPSRTIDLYWQSYPQEVIYVRKNRREAATREVKSRMPVVLRNLAPDTAFDPREMWAKEKKRAEEAKEAAAAAEAEAKQAGKQKGKKGGAKKPTKKEEMIERNKKDQEAKDVKLDLEKLENAVKACRSRSAVGATVLATKCETQLGRLRQLLLVLEAELKEQNMAAVLDVLWAIEATPLYASALAEGEEQEEEKKNAGGKKGGGGKGGGKSGAARSPEAAQLHEFRKELRAAREARKGLGSGLAAFQLEKMYDRLPPLSPFLKGWKLDAWQKRVLHHVDQRKSAIVCAPTSSGKTVISTYTCVNSGRVLFVVPTEPLVWQVAAMFQKLLAGSTVALATNQLAYRPSEDRSKVVVGTPLAIESALVKIRGLIGGEVEKRWDYAQLEGGFADFDYAVFDEVHALDGEEGAALQRLVRSVTCPMLALSATVGNADELRDWWQAVRDDAAEAAGDAVELVEHRGRFINVQNLILDERDKLEPLHPCAALEARRLVDEGADKVSFALTPADCSSLYKALARDLGAAAVADLEPSAWFGRRAAAEEAKYVDGLRARVERGVPGAELALKRATEKSAAAKAAASTRLRITLDDSKSYESALKARLSELAAAEPDKCDAVLRSFVPGHLERPGRDASAFSMLAVASQMSDRKLFPALCFHLDSFRCLGLFKALVAELEAAEKAKYPNWADELRAKAADADRRAEQQAKMQERNAKAAEEEAKDGFDEGEVYVDVAAPHPEFVLAPPTARLSSKEIDDILDEVKKDTANKEVLAASHVLVRALRRGFALYIDDAAFSVYRRIVQRLAQKGKLAIVFSDHSLAYGVNMPFRTVAFCGDEGGLLTPLLAQQMAGRAGRRGLDTQGNLVYLGMDWDRIRRLMVGTVPAIVGRPPHFATIAVPLALSPEIAGPLALCKHVDRALVRRLCAASLEQHSAGTRRSALDSDATVNDCLKILDVIGLGTNFAARAADGAAAKDERPTLCMLWELRNYLPESVALASALPHLMDDFVKDRHNFKRATDDSDSEAVQIEFMSVLCHLVDRTPCAEGATPIHELTWLKKSPERVAKWDKWERLLIQWQDRCDLLPNAADAQSLKLAVVPGTPLDASVFECCKDRRLPPASQISSLDRHHLKLRLWNVGNILLKAHNCLQLPGDYITLSPLLRKCFRRIMYILSDDINANVDDQDVTQAAANREAAAEGDEPTTPPPPEPPAP